MDLRVGIGTVNLGVDEEELVDLLRDQEDTEKGREVLTVEEEEEEDQAALMIETLTRSHRTEVIEVIEANEEEEEEEEVVISEEGVHTVESEVKEEVDIKARFPRSLSCSRYTARIFAYSLSPL